MKNTARHLLLASALGGLLLPTAFASTVTATDPSPDVYDEETSDQLDGGIPFTWTVVLGGNDSAVLKGVVGAWSWDEDSFPETAKGWTHTSNWVALAITSPSRVTIRLQRQAGIVDPFASIPGTLAGDNLYPAFTVYSGWDGDGSAEHTYNNRGNVAWAEDIAYTTHVENDGKSIVELTLDFPAGRYSIAMGGNSPSDLAEGRQGYLATLLSESLLPDPSIRFAGKKRIKTSKNKFKLTGKVANGTDLDKVRYKLNGRMRTAKVRGSRWISMLKLKAGRNVVLVWAYENNGTKSKPAKIVIIKE